MLCWLTTFAFAATAWAQCVLPTTNVPTPNAAQSGFSYYGNAFTPLGHLHILMVYVQFEDVYKANPSVMGPISGSTEYVLANDWGHNYSIVNGQSIPDYKQ